MIKQQFEVPIKAFRTDHAKDFCNHELKAFFEEEGIRHETCCPYMPQQNGLAERKLGDIMDKRRTLMIQAYLPKHLWNFPIMTAVHLINRLPSVVIGLHSPLELIEKFFPKVRLQTGLKPQVFGCVAFIHTHNTSSDKLSARAVRCVCWLYDHTERLQLSLPKMPYLMKTPPSIHLLVPLIQHHFPLHWTATNYLQPNMSFQIVEQKPLYPYNIQHSPLDH